MPRPGRLVHYGGAAVRLAQLAQAHRVPLATVIYRLDVRGLPIERALATGALSPSASARRNRRRLDW